MLGMYTPLVAMGARYCNTLSVTRYSTHLLAHVIILFAVTMLVLPFISYIHQGPGRSVTVLHSGPGFLLSAYGDPLPAARTALPAPPRGCRAAPSGGVRLEQYVSLCCLS